ncbi:hypothetical protein Pmani_025618 [Petrolisthes manimaculis]|uniref:Uncharacterized protein n=1 Tax=Petrolisthes manimaculis TaxID=1843537 RepID=A0AAE1P5U1_9EUCA|nr:hypothetical protein Pmani_025618 [Petrolisthes manimaculis]
MRREKTTDGSRWQAITSPEVAACSPLPPFPPPVLLHPPSHTRPHPYPSCQATLTQPSTVSTHITPPHSS